MTFIKLDDIFNTRGYYIDDKTLDIYNGLWNGLVCPPKRKMNGSKNKTGRCFTKYNENGSTSIVYHDYIVVKKFIDPNFDYKVSKIIHIDNDPYNVAIDNLKIVPKFIQL